MSMLRVVSRSQIGKFTLRRAYTTSTTQHHSQLTKISPFLVPAISTLRPKKLVLSDFLVLAGKSRPSFRTRLPDDTPLVRVRLGQSTTIRYKPYKIDGTNGAKLELEESGETEIATEPFPRHARGFLYLHQPQPESDLPRSASAIRFRCVPSLAERYFLYSTFHGGTPIPRTEPFILPLSSTEPNDYEAFKTGYDLTLPNGKPWNISVILVAGYPSLEFIRMQLLKDDIFSESEFQDFKDIYNKQTENRRTGVLLDGMDSVFPVRFDAAMFQVLQFKVGLSGFERVFMDQRSKHRNVLPYTGAGFASLELAPGSSRSRPGLCLRIVKITEPVKCVVPNYDGFVHMPREGALVSRGLPGESRLWIFRLNPTSSRHSTIIKSMPVRVENGYLS